MVSSLHASWWLPRRSARYDGVSFIISLCTVLCILKHGVYQVNADTADSVAVKQQTSDMHELLEQDDLYTSIGSFGISMDKKLMGQQQGTAGKSSKVAQLQSGQENTLGALLLDLEDRVSDLESKAQYPPVKFLDYRVRKRILVTGGAGFVGSHLVDRLMMMGHEVIVVDNFFTGRKRNVLRWMGHPNFELRNQDVVDELRIEVDQIYHLASPASPPHYMENPIKTLKTNTVGTLNMLGLAKRNHARFLLASTSEVYGDPEVHPQKETYWGHVNPIGPRGCYDEGKRAAEALTYAYARYENLDVRVARIFNTFGPRMHMNDGRVVSNFILAALRHEPIRIYGDGKNTRSFQYVSDLVTGLIALMNSNYTQPVNLGNPEEHTIGEFARIIKDLTGSDVQITNVEAAVDDPQRRKPDISLALREIGWKPAVPMREGLDRTIRFFRTELELSHQAESMKIPLDLG